MPMKDKEAEREYQRAHYQANKQLYKERARINRLKQRRVRQEYVRKIKETTPCADCGSYYPYYVMDFDHLDGKEMAVSHMIRGTSLKRVKEEIAKCEVVCSNCHRERSYRRLVSLSSVSL